MAKGEMDANELALAQLEALVKVRGALRIITAEVHPDHRVDRKDVRSPAKEGVDLRQPKSFVIHNVTKLEGPNARGQYTARSDEGDYTVGQPAALLARLQEWQREVPG